MSQNNIDVIRENINSINFHETNLVVKISLIIHIMLTLLDEIERIEKDNQLIRKEIEI